MAHTMKIRRSGAYGIAGVITLLGCQFLPLSTPPWCFSAIFSLVCMLAGFALFFNVQERKLGETKRSIGFFALAVLMILFALLFVFL